MTSSGRHCFLGCLCSRSTLFQEKKNEEKKEEDEEIEENSTRTPPLPPCPSHATPLSGSVHLLH